VLELKYYETNSGRSEPVDYISELPARLRAQVLADLEALRIYGNDAPISLKRISGYAPMFEVRVGGQRVYCVVHRETVWVLQAGAKDQQRRDIEKAARRMSHVKEG
jgi:hypothetical protein